MAMPQLTRFTFRMPLSSWLDGEHARFINMPEPLLQVLAIQPKVAPQQEQQE